MNATSKVSCLLALILVIPITADAGTEDGTGAEHDAIEAAVRDYIDGWYTGDVERMTRALHPDLAKRTVRTLENGMPYLRTVSASTMIAFTRAGFGKESHRDDHPTEVRILDVSSVTACVKTVSHEYIDYLHLAKIAGRWRIVNVLWEPAGD